MRKKESFSPRERKIFFTFCTTLFVLSLTYWGYWIYRAVIGYQNGVSTDWFISSLSSHDMLYGIEAIKEVGDMCILSTILIFWWIPIYELIYIVIVCIKKANKDMERIKKGRTSNVQGQMFSKQG